MSLVVLALEDRVCFIGAGKTKTLPTKASKGTQGLMCVTPLPAYFVPPNPPRKKMKEAKERKK